MEIPFGNILDWVQFKGGSRILEKGGVGLLSRSSALYLGNILLIRGDTRNERSLVDLPPASLRIYVICPKLH